MKGLKKMDKISVTQQKNGEPVTTEILVEAGSFNLKEDYFDYMNGTKTDEHGNSVGGAMIGPNFYCRFVDVIDIHVEPAEEGEVDG